jgi:PBP1b-binding outer membrane lipoprotein LpoB
MKYPISYIYQGEEKKIILAITRNNQFNQNSVETIRKDKFESVAEPGKVKRLKRNVFLSHM